MKYWLMKSEPSAYAWRQLVEDKSTAWSGVRNYQANNNMKAMAKGDLAFFYHSNEERAIVGIMKIKETWHLDPTDESGKFGMVMVSPLKAMTAPVSLASIKGRRELAEMVFLRQGRLSVSPVSEKEAHVLLEMGETKA